MAGAGAPAATGEAGELELRGVFVDARGDILRIGPAPYLRDDQLTDAVAALGEVIRAAQGGFQVPPLRTK